MPLDHAELSPGFARRTEGRLDAPSTIIPMPDIDIQAMRALDTRRAGGDHIGLPSTPHTPGSSTNIDALDAKCSPRTIGPRNSNALQENHDYPLGRPQYPLGIPKTSTSLLDLPNEILSHILLPLPVPDMIRSQGVCSNFNSIIRSSAEARYRISLEISGLEDNETCSSFSTLERLEKVLTGQKAWRQFKPQFVTHIKAPGPPWGYYDLRGGVYAQNGAKAFKVSCAPLPKTEGEGVEWTTFDLQERCIDVALCVREHDLIVIMAEGLRPMGSFEIALHIRQFSSGQPHPEAQQPRIPAYTNGRTPSSFNVNIFGDNLVVRLTRPDHLMVYKWRTGILKADLLAPSRSYTGCALLEENILLLANVRRGALEIWDLASEPYPLVPTCLLELPLPVPGMSYVDIQCRGEPNPTGAGGNASRIQEPYQCKAEDSIIGFDVEIGNSYSFFIHRKSLLRIAEGFRKGRALPPSGDCEASFGSTPFPTPIPWEKWGENNAKWIDTSNMAQTYITRSAGQRTVLIASGARYSPSPLIVMDFNPWTVKRYRYARMEEQRTLDLKKREEGHKHHENLGIARKPTEALEHRSEVPHAINAHCTAPTGATSGAENSPQETDSDSEPEETFFSGRDTKRASWALSETHVIDDRASRDCFAHPVRSRLPCVCFSSSQSFGYDSVMMDEERILGFKGDQEFDVLYFGQG